MALKIRQRWMITQSWERFYCISYFIFRYVLLLGNSLYSYTLHNSQETLVKLFLWQKLIFFNKSPAEAVCFSSSKLWPQNFNSRGSHEDVSPGLKINSKFGGKFKYWLRGSWRLETSEKTYSSLANISELLFNSTEAKSRNSQFIRIWI